MGRGSVDLDGTVHVKIHVDNRFPFGQTIQRVLVVASSGTVVEGQAFDGTIHATYADDLQGGSGCYRPLLNGELSGGNQHYVLKVRIENDCAPSGGNSAVVIVLSIPFGSGYRSWSYLSLCDH